MTGVHGTSEGDAIPLRRLPNEAAVARALIYPSLRDPVRLTIRDEVTWNEFWQRIARLPDNVETQIAPSVDFKHEMVLVAGDGWRSDGFVIDIAAVEGFHDKLKAYVRTGWDQADSLTDGMRGPLSIVLVPTDDRQVEFVSLPDIGRTY